MIERRKPIKTLLPPSLEGVGFESDPNLEHFEFQHQIRATVQPGAGALAEPKKESRKPGVQ